MKNFLVYAIVSGGNLGAFTIRTGDCFDNTSSLSYEDGGEVSSLPGVPCAEPHDNEVYAVFDVDHSSFPGDDQMGEIAFEQCHEKFSSFVGRDYESSTLDITALYPSSDSWRMQDDREVVCAVYDMNGGKLTGSARGSSL